MTKNNLPMWIVFGAAMVLSVTAGVFVGCDHGSNIPIGEEPTCVELVTDECVPEVIEEFCEECTSETDITLREAAAYRRGFAAGVASVECEVCEVCPDPPVCDEPPFCDTYGDDVPRGHLPKECRGNNNN
jgi:hypothetical protein